MNEYTFSDYGIFASAISDAKALGTSLSTGKSNLASSKAKLGDGSIFMGPACDSCLAAFAQADSKIVSMSDNFSAIEKYLMETASTYKSGDEAAASVLSMSNGKVSTVAGGSKVSLTGNTNQDQIYNYLASQGYNHAAICGILANIKHESGYRTDALGDGGTSYGICQWHAGRYEQLMNYCQQNNLDYTSLEGQLSYLSYELQKYGDLTNTLKNVPNTPEGAYQAAYQWTVQFERPANMDAAGQTRGSTAQSIMQEYDQSQTSSI